MANDELKRLRAEYKRVKRNVSAKINRITKATGAKLAGSEYDPRKPAGIENRYNKKQLESAIGKMQEFQQRNVQFVGLNRGVPVRAHEYKRYVKKSEKVAGVSGEFVGQIRDVKWVEDGHNVEEVYATRYHGPRFGGMNGGMSTEPFETAVHSPAGIKSLSALKKLEAQMDKQLKPEFFSQKLELAREQVMTALVFMGEDKNAARVMELSEFQFAVMWYGSTMAEDTFMKYETMQAMSAESPKDRRRERIIESTDISTFLDRAESLPATRVEYDNEKRGKTKR